MHPPLRIYIYKRLFFQLTLPYLWYQSPASRAVARLFTASPYSILLNRLSDNTSLPCRSILAALNSINQHISNATSTDSYVNIVPSNLRHCIVRFLVRYVTSISLHFASSERLKTCGAYFAASLNDKNYAVDADVLTCKGGAATWLEEAASNQVLLVQRRVQVKTIGRRNVSF